MEDGEDAEAAHRADAVWLCVCAHMETMKLRPAYTNYRNYTAYESRNPPIQDKVRIAWACLRRRGVEFRSMEGDSGRTIRSTTVSAARGTGRGRTDLAIWQNNSQQNRS